VFAAEFNGNLDGDQQERLLIKRLSEEGVLQTDEPSSWHGRKWRSCFTKLGLASYKDSAYKYNGYPDTTLADLAQLVNGLTGKSYELTPAGAALLASDTAAAIGDVFLRQLLRLEIPSPTEQEKPEENLKPLVLLLQVLYILHDRGELGLTKDEVALFIQTAQSDNDVEGRIDRLLDFRETLPGLANASEKRQYRRRVFERERIGDKPKLDTHIDYADTTIRYCSVTGLFSQRGRRISIRPERLQVIEGILVSEPDFLVPVSPLEYLVDFYTGTIIPTDDETIALREVGVFEELVIAKGEEPVTRAEELAGEQVQVLKNGLYRIEEQYLAIVERDFALNQREDEQQIRDIVAHLLTLDGGRQVSIPRDERPAYLEWVVWRGLMVLDHLATSPSETRNFKLDVDLLPIYHAPAGVPDMVIDYGDYLLVGEVTLTVGSRQEASEGEPVRRHVADIAGAHERRDIYGVFVAPRIDFNTAETFRIGNWYVRDTPLHLHIVPFSISQFARLVQNIGANRLTPVEFRRLLERCLISRNAPSPVWLEHIEKEVAKWVSNEV